MLNLILFVVTGAALQAAPASAEAAKPAAQSERKICRRAMRPGTMIRTQTVKVCRTASQWTRNEQDHQAMARSYQHAICAGQSNCQ